METKRLKLILPDFGHEKDVMAYRDAFFADQSTAGAGELDRFDDFHAWLFRLRKNEHESTVEPGYVHGFTFLAYDGDDLVGAVNLRLRLNERLLLRGGHIGYSVHPAKRRRGYAKQILRQTVQIANGFGIEPVLVTCLETNEASRRVILASGGVYQGTSPVDGYLEARYLIHTEVPDERH